MPPLPPDPWPLRQPALQPATSRRRRALAGLCAACLGGALLGAAGAARAQASNYPTRTLRLLVGDAAGSLADRIALALAAALPAELGQAVQVENRPGQDGAVAARAVADAAGDGHTGLLARVSNQRPPAPFSAPDADLMPVALVCRMVASASVPSTQTPAPAQANPEVQFALLGPATLHAGAAKRLHAAVQAALASADLQGRLAAVGAQPGPAPRLALAGWFIHPASPLLHSRTDPS